MNPFIFVILIALPFVAYNLGFMKGYDEGKTDLIKESNMKITQALKLEKE